MQSTPLRSRWSRLAAVVALLAILAAALPAGQVRPAAAQAVPGCQGSATRSITYSATSNLIYLRGCGQTFTLTQVAAAVGSARLELVDAVAMTWYLKANVRVEEGATLTVAGPAAGGDAGWLRLRSDDAGFVYLRSENGTLGFRNTKVTSWNATTGTVDTAYGVAGRAYVTVRTVVATGRTTTPSAACGTGGRDAYEGRMDVVSSEMSYLGYNMNEAWGVTWKVYTTDPALQPTETSRQLYAVADVFGDVVGNTLSHNYHGLYTFGGHCMNMSGNTVTDNVGYGLDPHDDSDYLVIDSNTVARNGYEGLICAEFCDHLTITNNDVYGNGQSGIMLYQATNDSLVEGNRSHDNGNAGIAILDSYRNTIRNNTVTNNAFSAISLTVGSSDNVVEGNTLTGAAAGTGSGYAVFTNGRGSDVPIDGGDGRVRRNQFRDNRISGSKTPVLKIYEASDSRFDGNAVTGPASSTAFDLVAGVGNVVTDTTYTGGITTHVKSTGTSALGATTTVEDGEVGKTIKVRLDPYSTIELRDTRSLIWRMTGTQNATRAGQVSTQTLTYASAGSSKDVTTLDFSVRPGNGTVTVVPTTWATSSPYGKAWTEASSTTTGTVPYVVGNLQAGMCYQVAVDGNPVGAYVAGGSGITGRISFAYAGGYGGGTARAFTVAASSVSPCEPPPAATVTSTPTATRTATSTPVATSTPTGTPTPTSTSTSTATVPASPIAFEDGFESGDLRAWTTANGLVVQSDQVLNGSFATRGTTSGAVAYAQRTLSSPQSDLYYRVRFKVVSKTTIGYLLRFRSATNSDIVGINISSSGKLGVYNRSTNVTTASSVIVSNGVWHEVELHVNQGTGLIEVWYDGQVVNALTLPQSVGGSPIGRVELGDASTGRTFDMVFDDVSLGTTFIPLTFSPEATATATPTRTPTPTKTPVPPATSTQVAATGTPVPPATGTPVPPATDTPVVPATSTPVPPATDTPAPPATSTPVPPPTSTPVPVLDLTITVVGGVPVAPGGTVTFEVCLASGPTTPVDVQLTSTSTTRASASPGSVTLSSVGECQTATLTDLETPGTSTGQVRLRARVGGATVEESQNVSFPGTAA